MRFPRSYARHKGLLAWLLRRDDLLSHALTRALVQSGRLLPLSIGPILAPVNANSMNIVYPPANIRPMRASSARPYHPPDLLGGTHFHVPRFLGLYFLPAIPRRFGRSMGLNRWCGVCRGGITVGLPPGRTPGGAAGRVPHHPVDGRPWAVARHYPPGRIWGRFLVGRGVGRGAAPSRSLRQCHGRRGLLDVLPGLVLGLPRDGHVHGTTCGGPGRGSVPTLTRAPSSRRGSVTGGGEDGSRLVGREEGIRVATLEMGVVQHAGPRELAVDALDVQVPLAVGR